MGSKEIPVVQIDRYTGKVVARYESIKKAAKAVGSSTTAIRRHLYPSRAGSSHGAYPGQSIWIAEERFEEMKAVGLLKAVST